MVDRGHDVWRWSDTSGRMVVVPGAAAVWPRPLSHYDRLYGVAPRPEGWWVNLAASLVIVAERWPQQLPEQHRAAAHLAGASLAWVL